MRKTHPWRVLVGLLLTVMTVKAQAPAQSRIKIGDLAPDFTLVDQNGQPHSLHDYKGKKNVALAFYVFAFAPA